MAVYFIRGFTAVPGDAAYVEATSAREAGDHLMARLDAGGIPDSCTAREHWEVTEMQSPICVVVWRD